MENPAQHPQQCSFFLSFFLLPFYSEGVKVFELIHPNFPLTVSIHPSTYLPSVLIHSPIHPYIHPPIHTSTHPLIHPPTHLSSIIHLSIINQSSIHPSIHLSCIHQSFIHPPIHLSVYPSILQCPFPSLPFSHCAVGVP